MKRSQQKKSLAHLQIQLHLKSLLPGSVLEKPFPTTGRIADVYWEEKKLVFEVQCSPLSLQEAEQRCRDYLTEQVIPVWILYTQKFNGTYLSAAERFLRTGLCYFSDGARIYDQFEVVAEKRRLFHGPPLPVDLSCPLRKGSSLYFKGDFKDLLATHPSPFFKQKEREILRYHKPFFIRRLYRELFYYLLGNIN